MLFVCPTPIGNLGDITLRTLDVLRAVDLVACEDTRRTGRLLDHFGISKPLVSFFEHNEVRRLDLLLGELAEGKQVALVSDAGMPGLSDPGFTLVRACVERGLPLTVLPGASSVDTALVLSGLPTDRFVFVGFLPRGPKQIVRMLEQAGSGGGAIVAFDSAQRIVRTLAAIEARWPDRALAVCRELTKVHEEVVRGTAAQARGEFAGRDRVRGEIVLVVAPEGAVPASRVAGESGAGHDVARVATSSGPAARAAERTAVRAMLARGMGVKETAGVVAGLTGAASRDAYRLVQAVKDDPAVVRED
jgi:16S rRNA (cytidine1402-2'-O)-methyltransferase